MNQAVKSRVQLEEQIWERSWARKAYLETKARLCTEGKWPVSLEDRVEVLTARLQSEEYDLHEAVKLRVPRSRLVVFEARLESTKRALEKLGLWVDGKALDRPLIDDLVHDRPEVIRGYRNVLAGAIRLNRDGATVELDLTSAKGILNQLDRFLAVVDRKKLPSGKPRQGV